MTLGLVAGLFAGSACTGGIGVGANGGGANRGGADATGGGESGSVGQGGNGPISQLDCPKTNAVPPAPLRRLSRVEYWATLKDLFPGISLGTVAFLKDAADRGFENRAKLLNPSPLLIEQLNDGAAAVAAKAMANPASLLPCTPTAATEADCASKFIDAFGEKAFRRPLSVDEKSSYLGLFNTARAGGTLFNAAAQLTVQAFLQAPQFLYRIELGTAEAGSPDRLRLTQFEVATRMSYLLWGSAPDATLMEKARQKQLETSADRESEVRRMLGDPRATGMFVEFHRQWLDFDQLDNEPKDPKTYPAFTPELKTAMRAESDRFVANVMGKGDGTLRSLLTSPTTEVDATLAELYGVSPPASGWKEVSLDPMERAGILTRANFLASHGHMVSGSPPLRAVYTFKRLLCHTIGSPPGNVDLTQPVAKVGTISTNRQLFEQRLAPAACSACHTVFDPLGYAFENYDGIGRYRTTDNGLPVDATGQLEVGDINWQISNGVDLSTKLAESPEVQACVASQWFEYAQGREKSDADECSIQTLANSFVAKRGDMRELLVALVKDPDFTFRPIINP